MRTKTNLKVLLTTACAGYTLGYGLIANAADLNLSQAPVYLGTAVTPNVFIQLDDSGSMDWEILTQKFWFYSNYWKDQTENVKNNGRWYSDSGSSSCSGTDPYTYIFTSTDNAYQSGSYSCTLQGHSQSAVRDWRIRSADFNLVYYNHDASYEPWPGTGMSDADFDAAYTDPEPSSTGHATTRDLDGFVYEVWEDSHGFSGDRPRGPGTATATGNAIVDLWDNHTRYTVKGDTIEVEQFTHTHPFSSSTDCTLDDAQASTPYQDCFNASPTIDTTLSGTDTHALLGDKTIAEVKQNIANWYQYARRRSFVAKGAIGGVVTESPYYRYGLGMINESNRLSDVPTDERPDYVAHNNTLLKSLFAFDWQGRGTPLRRGLENVGEYYSQTGTSSPIISECQQNFSVLMTDGYWSGSAATNSDIKDKDNDGDGDKNTLADVARYYYLTDLNDSLDNNLVTNAFDGNPKQHMVTFTAAFGVQGLLEDTDGDGWPNPVLAENGDWGDPDDSDSEKIDDLWHAAYNSRGVFLSARTPEDLVEGLRNVLANIAERTSSGNALEADSGTLSTDSNLFQVRFDSTDWSGELFALAISDGSASGPCPSVPAGKLCPTPVWNAADGLDTRTSARQILTYKPSTHGGIPFAWPSDPSTPSATELDAGQIAALNDNPQTAALDDDGAGEARLGFVRGDTTYDGNTGTGPRFRDRTSILGDIIHSDPTFVGKSRFRYPDTLETGAYSSFRATNATRRKMLYVGGNDGMLHGFDVISGEERFAYVPSVVYPNLNRLTSPTYGHHYFVDGTPTVVDVFYDGAWHTVLVGGLRGGGQGIYALDVTEPDTITEANAASKALWEFTDSDDAATPTKVEGDPDLGYTYGGVSIVKLNNGKWAAVFGNGYNNTENDGSASTTGKAALYIVDIETGSLIKKFAVGDALPDPVGSATPNGLATPTPIDIDRDFDADYIYAGDLHGNVWRFDLTDASAANWTVGNAMFTAKDDNDRIQPITNKMEVGAHPLGLNHGVLVYFGTGKYMEVGDGAVASTDPSHSFYAVWDKFDGSAITRSNLREQEIITELDYNDNAACDGDVDELCVRVTTANDVTWTGDTAQRGWYMDVTASGERMVTDPLLRGGRIIFTTLIPSSNPCSFGGGGWLMELSAATGSRLEISPFDLNADGDFTQTDYVEVIIDGVTYEVPVSGLRPGSGDPDDPVGGIPRIPKIVSEKVNTKERPGGGDGSCKEFKFLSDSNGNVSEVTESCGGAATGRQTWRQLR